MRKSKLIVEQGYHDPKQYTVVKLVNRVVPEIGHVLKREDLQKLMAELPDMAVEVLPSKQERKKH